MHQCEQSFELSDREESERDSDSKIIEFKESPQWQFEYQKLKDILKSKEHVKRK